MSEETTRNAADDDRDEGATMAESEVLPSAEVAESDDPKTLGRLLEEERGKAERYLASWQRAQADFANFKRRAEQERAETLRFGNTKLILKLLPVVDDLERALGNIPPEAAGQPWVEGMRLIYRKLLSVLESEGLAAIEAEGRDFDPHEHEAVMYEEGGEGKVLQELQRGYRLNDRVIRASMVKVGRQTSGREEEQ